MLKFLQSVGSYGIMVGAFMVLAGLFQWESVYVVVGFVGIVLSYGWFRFFGIFTGKTKA